MRRTPFALFTVFALSLLVPCSFAGNTQPTVSNAPITIETRYSIVRTLNAEKVFIKKPFPQGEKGITIHNGEVSPDDQTLITWSMNHGPAARPGERAQITNIEFKDKQIIFEINGGPKKKAKWYQR